MLSQASFAQSYQNPEAYSQLGISQSDAIFQTTPHDPEGYRALRAL